MIREAIRKHLIGLGFQESYTHNHILYLPSWLRIGIDHGYLVVTNNLWQSRVRIYYSDPDLFDRIDGFRRSPNVMDGSYILGTVGSLM